MHSRKAGLVVALVAIHTALALLYSPDLDRGDQVQYMRVASSLLDHGPANYLDPPFRVQKGDYFPWFRGDVDDPDGPYNPIFWDPLYPVFVASIFASAGKSVAAIRGAQILLSVGTLLFGMAAVRRMFPDEERASPLFGALYVGYLPFAGFATKVMAETLDTFLLSAIVYCATFLTSRRVGPMLLFGLLLGCYALIKSYFLQLMPIVVLGTTALLWQRDSDSRTKQRLLAGAVVMLLGFAAATAPTMIRNQNLAGAAVISTKGPWNFWKDNNNFQLVQHDWRSPGVKVHIWLRAYYEAGSTEAVSKLLPSVYLDARVPIRPPCDLPLAESSACERNAAVAWILEDPLRFAGRAVQKVASLWSPNNYVFNRAPAGSFAWHQNYSVDLPTPLRWALQILVIAGYVCAMLAFFAAMLVPPRSEADRLVRAFALLCLIFLSTVVVPVGHGVSRFRLPFMLFVLQFAALGLLRGRNWVENFRTASNRVRVPVAIAATVWIGIVAWKLPPLLAP